MYFDWSICILIDRFWLFDRFAFWLIDFDCLIDLHSDWSILIDWSICILIDRFWLIGRFAFWLVDFDCMIFRFFFNMKNKHWEMKIKHEFKYAFKHIKQMFVNILCFNLLFMPPAANIHFEMQKLQLIMPPAAKIHIFLYF